jgi:hypothetical protein
VGGQPAVRGGKHFTRTPAQFSMSHSQHPESGPPYPPDGSCLEHLPLHGPGLQNPCHALALEPDLSSLRCRKAGTGAVGQVGAQLEELAWAAPPPNSHRSRSTDAERAAARQTGQARHDLCVSDLQNLPIPGQPLDVCGVVKIIPTQDRRFEGSLVHRVGNRMAPGGVGKLGSRAAWFSSFSRIR